MRKSTPAAARRRSRNQAQSTAVAATVALASEWQAFQMLRAAQAEPVAVAAH